MQGNSEYNRGQIETGLISLKKRYCLAHAREAMEGPLETKRTWSAPRQQALRDIQAKHPWLNAEIDATLDSTVRCSPEGWGRTVSLPLEEMRVELILEANAVLAYLDRQSAPRDEKQR